MRLYNIYNCYITSYITVIQQLYMFYSYITVICYITVIQLLYNSFIAYMTADVCCYITVIRRLTSYNFYQTSAVR